MITKSLYLYYCLLKAILVGLVQFRSCYNLSVMVHSYLLMLKRTTNVMLTQAHSAVTTKTNPQVIRSISNILMQMACLYTLTKYL